MGIFEKKTNVGGYPELVLASSSLTDLGNKCSLSNQDACYFRREFIANQFVVIRGNTESPATNSTENLLCALGRALGEFSSDPFFGQASTRQRFELRDPFQSQFSHRSWNVSDNPYVDFPLHTDGSFLPRRPEWIGFALTNLEFSIGGETKILRLDDWEDRDHFSSNPLGEIPISWFPPHLTSLKSKELLFQANSCLGKQSPVFCSARDGLSVRFAQNCINKNCMPKVSGLYEYLREIADSLAGSSAIKTIRLNKGDMYFANNLTTLHGRGVFRPSRSLLRCSVRVQGFLKEK